MLPPRYEWCKFRHVPSGRVCDFEWNEAAYNITVLNCEDFAGRFVFLGKYNDYNCAVRIENARGEDAGQWVAEVEEYYSGYYRGYGYNATANFNVEVRDLSQKIIRKS